MCRPTHLDTHQLCLSLCLSVKNLTLHMDTGRFPKGFRANEHVSLGHDTPRPRAETRNPRWCVPLDAEGSRRAESTLPLAGGGEALPGHLSATPVDGGHLFVAGYWCPVVSAGCRGELTVL